MSLVFLWQGNVKKFKKVDENSSYWGIKSSYINYEYMNNLRNFNEIFGKNVTCDNVKSHKKAGLHLLSRKCNSGIIRGGGRGGGVKLTPPTLFRVKTR